MKKDLEALIAEERAEIISNYNKGRQNGASIDSEDFNIYKAVDRFGFLHEYELPTPTALEEKQKHLEIERIPKWVKMIKKWDKYRNSDKMIRRVYKGIPLQLRGQIWSLLLDLEKLKSENEGKYERMKMQAQKFSSEIKQIDLDVNRTFRNHIMFRDRYGVKLYFQHFWPLNFDGKNSENHLVMWWEPNLVQVVFQKDLSKRNVSGPLNNAALELSAINKDWLLNSKLYFMYSPPILYTIRFECCACGINVATKCMINEVSYCQGMSQLAAILLMYLNEEDAFWALSQLLTDQKHAMHGFFIPGFPKLQRFQGHHDQILSKLMPKLKKHLDKEQMSTGIYTTKWFLQCFIERTPFTLTLRLWDIYILEGEKVLAAMAYTIMKLHKKHLVKMSLEDLREFLQEIMSKNFHYEDDVVIDQLEKSISELRKLKLELPPPAKPDEFPSKPLGQEISVTLAPEKTNIMANGKNENVNAPPNVFEHDDEVNRKSPDENYLQPSLPEPQVPSPEKYQTAVEENLAHLEVSESQALGHDSSKSPSEDQTQLPKEGETQLSETSQSPSLEKVTEQSPKKENILPAESSETCTAVNSPNPGLEVNFIVPEKETTNSPEETAINCRDMTKAEYMGTNEIAVTQLLQEQSACSSELKNVDTESPQRLEAFVSESVNEQSPEKEYSSIEASPQINNELKEMENSENLPLLLAEPPPAELFSGEKHLLIPYPQQTHSGLIVPHQLEAHNLTDKPQSLLAMKLSSPEEEELIFTDLTHETSVDLNSTKIKDMGEFQSGRRVSDVSMYDNASVSRCEYQSDQIISEPIIHYDEVCALTQKELLGLESVDMTVRAANSSLALDLIDKSQPVKQASTFYQQSWDTYGPENCAMSSAHQSPSKYSPTVHKQDPIRNPNVQSPEHLTAITQTSPIRQCLNSSCKVVRSMTSVHVAHAAEQNLLNFRHMALPPQDDLQLVATRDEKGTCTVKEIDFPEVIIPVSNITVSLLKVPAYPSPTDTDIQQEHATAEISNLGSEKCLAVSPEYQDYESVTL